MTINSEMDKINVVPRIPLLLRIISIIILVEGVLGFLFFMAAGLFQLSDTNFVGFSGLNGLTPNFYSFYIILHIALFSGFILSGIFMLKLKKKGYYLFIINYLILTGFGIYLNDVFVWTTIIVGLGFITVLTYYFKKMF